MQTYNDYDKALYYTYCCNWDKLLVLMVQTNDQLFSKRIEHFLHAYQYSKELPEVDKQLQPYFNILTTHPKKSHVEEVEQIQM